LIFRIKREAKHMLKATERDMKDTGVTRRIDELGRIVIPREMRKTLRIRVGNPLEFYSDAEKIIIKKYSPLASLENSAKAVAQAIAEITQKSCVIVDKQKVVYIGDQIFKDILGANRANIPSILVKYIGYYKKQKIGIKRHLERIILKIYQKNKKAQNRLGGIELEV
jgi:stage V sporulation protein T